MSGTRGKDRPRATAKGMIVLIIVVLAIGTAGGANRPGSPGQSNLLNPPQPQQQSASGPVQFGPAHPTLASPAAFTPDMTFAQAIDILRNSTRPPLNMVVLWREIEENAGVDRNTEIGIDGLRGIRVRQCLEILLSSVSATAPVKIGYAVDHGVITVATVDSLPKPKRVARVYDISDLVAPPSGAMGPTMMSGMMPGMMPGFGGGTSYGGYGSNYGGYSPGYGGGYGGYGRSSGYNSAGGLPGFIGGMGGMGVYGR